LELLAESHARMRSRKLPIVYPALGERLGDIEHLVLARYAQPHVVVFDV
jgi:hypothetical protein